MVCVRNGTTFLRKYCINLVFYTQILCSDINFVMKFQCYGVQYHRSKLIRDIFSVSLNHLLQNRLTVVENWHYNFFFKKLILGLKVLNLLKKGIYSYKSQFYPINF